MSSQDRPIDPDWYVHYLHVCATNEPVPEPNFCDVIAYTRGWQPLTKGEKMTVHYEDKEYVIERKS